MYSLETIFQQAIDKPYAVVTDMPMGVNVIYLGIKIQKFEDRIEILGKRCHNVVVSGSGQRSQVDHQLRLLG